MTPPTSSDRYRTDGRTDGPTDGPTDDRRSSLLERVRTADPLNHATVDARSRDSGHDSEQEHLTVLRHRILSRLEAEATLTGEPGARTTTPGHLGSRTAGWSGTWQRRMVLGGAVAAVAAGALAAVHAVAPGALSLRAGQPLLTAGISASGEVTCRTGGYAAPIAASSAPVRWLPAQLPAGWSVTGVLARSSTSDSPCAVPSVFALATDSSGVVQATVSVVGPVHVDLAAGSLGTPTSATVDGHPARLFDLSDGSEDAGDGDDDAGSTRWVWTDGGGRTWQAETSGYDLAQAGTAVAGIHTDGDRATLDASVLPGLRVVHQRSGEPYGSQEQHLDWYVELSDGSQPRQLDVLSALDDDAALTRTWLEQYAVVGARLTTVGDRPALVGPTGSDASSSSGGVAGELTPVIVQLDPRTVVWTLAADDVDAVSQVVASLADVPADDPRLRAPVGRG